MFGWENLRRILREIFGGGANISAANPLPVDISPRDEALIKYLLNVIRRPMWVEPGTGRVRLTVEAGTLPTVTTVTTVTTCATVTSMTNLAGFSAKDTLLNHQKRVAWSLGVRNRIT